jgi:tRNA-Thr(GGU) m(6)t(6)A37 methyltransferase TsaA
MDSIALIPVGVVRSTRAKPSDDNWDAERARVELDPARFSAEALAGLADFSHVEIVFFMDRVDPGTVQMASRHPRNHAEWPKVGIFAQRGKNRPNQIGATICRILSVAGLSVHVAGLDAIDGTPVLDIKPWVQEFGPRGAVRQPAWISELMRGYWSE